MKTLKEIAKDLDLYGPVVLLEALKKEFSHVSFTANGKTIPNAGSHCRKTSNMLTDWGVKFNKVIFHKNNRVTVRTEQGKFYQFLNV